MRLIILHNMFIQLIFKEFDFMLKVCMENKNITCVFEREENSVIYKLL